MTGTIILKPGREKSLLRHHPWVFSGAIREYKGKLHSGDTVDVLASDGRWLACGAWSPESQIRVRIWTFAPDESIDNAFFLRRLETAVAGRAGLSSRQTAYRIVASESDSLPGITIDRYEDLLVCQLLSAGADKHRDKLVWALQKLFPGFAILERSDVRVRDKEGLAPIIQVLSGDVPDEVEFTENGLRFIADIKNGHKTGFYLDQRENRVRIAEYAAGQDVLNCFSYSGAVAVYWLAAGAMQVINVDQSDTAL
ncbi:MAG: class I SAM-dependent methyltransferase, partial [Pseudohongiellaceae bacterium]